MDETNKRIHNMVQEGLEKAGLDTSTKLSGRWSFHARLDKALKSSGCYLLLCVKCTCSYPEARLRLQPTEGDSVTTTTFVDANGASSQSCLSTSDWFFLKKGFASTGQPKQKELSASAVMLFSLTFKMESWEADALKYKSWGGYIGLGLQQQ